MFKIFKFLNKFDNFAFQHFIIIVGTGLLQALAFYNSLLLQRPANQTLMDERENVGRSVAQGWIHSSATKYLLSARLVGCATFRYFDQCPNAAIRLV